MGGDDLCRVMPEEWAFPKRKACFKGFSQGQAHLSRTPSSKGVTVHKAQPLDQALWTPKNCCPCTVGSSMHTEGIMICFQCPSKQVEEPAVQGQQTEEKFPCDNAPFKHRKFLGGLYVRCLHVKLTWCSVPSAHIFFLVSGKVYMVGFYATEHPLCNCHHALQGRRKNIREGSCL